MFRRKNIAASDHANQIQESPLLDRGYLDRPSDELNIEHRFCSPLNQLLSQKYSIPQLLSLYPPAVMMQALEELYDNHRQAFMQLYFQIVSAWPTNTQTANATGNIRLSLNIEEFKENPSLSITEKGENGIHIDELFQYCLNTDHGNNNLRYKKLFFEQIVLAHIFVFPVPASEEIADNINEFHVAISQLTLLNPKEDQDQAQIILAHNKLQQCLQPLLLQGISTDRAIAIYIEHKLLSLKGTPEEPKNAEETQQAKDTALTEINGVLDIAISAIQKKLKAEITFLAIDTMLNGRETTTDINGITQFDFNAETKDQLFEWTLKALRASCFTKIMDDFDHRNFGLERFSTLFSQILKNIVSEKLALISRVTGDNEAFAELLKQLKINTITDVDELIQLERTQNGYNEDGLDEDRIAYFYQIQQQNTGKINLAAKAIELCISPLELLPSGTLNDNYHEALCGMRIESLNDRKVAATKINYADFKYKFPAQWFYIYPQLSGDDHDGLQLLLKLDKFLSENQFELSQTDSKLEDAVNEAYNLLSKKYSNNNQAIIAACNTFQGWLDTTNLREERLRQLLENIKCLATHKKKFISSVTSATLVKIDSETCFITNALNNSSKRLIEEAKNTDFNLTKSLEAIVGDIITIVTQHEQIREFKTRECKIQHQAIYAQDQAMMCESMHTQLTMQAIINALETGIINCLNHAKEKAKIKSELQELSQLETNMWRIFSLLSKALVIPYIDKTIVYIKESRFNELKALLDTQIDITDDEIIINYIAKIKDEADFSGQFISLVDYIQLIEEYNVENITSPVIKIINTIIKPAENNPNRLKEIFQNTDLLHLLLNNIFLKFWLKANNNITTSLLADVLNLMPKSAVQLLQTQYAARRNSFNLACHYFPNLNFLKLVLLERIFDSLHMSYDNDHSLVLKHFKESYFYSLINHLTEEEMVQTLDGVLEVYAIGQTEKLDFILAKIEEQYETSFDKSLSGTELWRSLCHSSKLLDAQKKEHKELVEIPTYDEIIYGEYSNYPEQIFTQISCKFIGSKQAALVEMFTQIDVAIFKIHHNSENPTMTKMAKNWNTLVSQLKTIEPGSIEFYRMQTRLTKLWEELTQRLKISPDVNFIATDDGLLALADSAYKTLVDYEDIQTNIEKIFTTYSAKETRTVVNSYH